LERAARGLLRRTRVALLYQVPTPVEVGGKLIHGFGVHWSGAAATSRGQRARAGPDGQDLGGGRPQSWATMRLPGWSAFDHMPCQPWGIWGSAQKNRYLASRGERFTQPWLICEP